MGEVLAAIEKVEENRRRHWSTPIGCLSIMIHWWPVVLLLSPSERSSAL